MHDRDDTAPRRPGVADVAALLAAIVSSSSDAILSLSVDGTVTSWNAATECLLGYSAAEMIGQSIRRIIPSELQAEEDKLLRRLEAGELIERYETVRLRKDRQRLDVSMTISPLRSPAGKVLGASNIIGGITESKRSKAQINDLLKEVNHRSKNMLALVQAIARQTVPSEQGEFLQRFLGWIQALSSNQDLLINNDWQGIGMEKLVQAHVMRLPLRLESRIQIEGPLVQLTSGAAQAIGLALHELASNAASYGALSRPDGRVRIRWARKNGDFSIEWSEHDGPPAHPPAQPGFGTRVLSLMPQIGIGARTEVDYATSGLTWRLNCPAERAVAGGEHEGEQVK